MFAFGHPLYSCDHTDTQLLPGIIGGGYENLYDVITTTTTTTIQKGRDKSRYLIALREKKSVLKWFITTFHNMCGMGKSPMDTFVSSHGLQAFISPSLRQHRAGRD